MHEDLHPKIRICSLGTANITDWVKQRANLSSAWDKAEHELVYARLQNEWNTI